MAAMLIYNDLFALDAVIQLQPLALPPQTAAQLLSISKRSLSRLIAAGKIAARKEGSCTLVDVES